MTVDTSTEAVERLHDTLGSVSVVPMQGDNLAITLCTAFDAEDSDDRDDNGWSLEALSGCSVTLEAIHDHYTPTLAALTTEVDRLRDALRWVERMVDEAPRAPEAAEHWLDRIEEIVRAARAPKEGEE